MNEKSWRIRRLCVMAMLCTMAYVSVALIRIPVVEFLKYEPKDVLLVIGGFVFGPVVGAALSAVVGLLELVTVSDTGIIGLIMNFLSSSLFVCVASAVYKKNRSIRGAVIGLLCGVICMATGMVLWNYLITPLYMGVSRDAIEGMLLSVFLPFNLFKGVLNASLTLLLYKPIISALRRTRLLPPPATTDPTQRKRSVWLAAIVTITLMIIIWLVWSGKI